MHNIRFYLSSFPYRILHTSANSWGGTFFCKDFSKLSNSAAIVLNTRWQRRWIIQRDSEKLRYVYIFKKGCFYHLSTLKSPVIANKNTCLKYKYDTSTMKQLKANERDIIVFKKIIRLAKFQWEIFAIPAE